MAQSRERVRRVWLRYEVDSFYEDWVVDDQEKAPESRPHDLVGERVRQLLQGWKERTKRDAQIGRNLALRWDEEHPRIGVDPDVYVVEPPPPEGDEVTSLRTWETGHFPPLLAVEIVSASRPDKDYGQSPEKYAASGTQELWVFDPKLAGPAIQGGPFRLQVWRRDESGDFQRVYRGEGPAWSEAIGGWVFAVDEGRSIAIANDEAGTDWWMTLEEQARANEQAALASARSEREAKEAALKRIAELEAQLAGNKPSKG